MGRTFGSALGAAILVLAFLLTAGVPAAEAQTCACREFNSTVVVGANMCTGSDGASGCDADYLPGDDLEVIDGDPIIWIMNNRFTASPTIWWELHGTTAGFEISNLAGTGSNPVTIETATPNDTLYLDSAGFVGVGTPTPAVKTHLLDTSELRLRVQSGTGATADYTDLYVGGTGLWFADSLNAATETYPVKFNHGAPTNTLVVEGTSGEVGIGTAGPAVRLHVGPGSLPSITPGAALMVQEGTASAMVLKSTGGQESIFYQDANNGIFGTVSTSPMGIRTNNVNRVWITSGGNVGIGTTAPATALHVIGTITATGAKNFAMPDPEDATKMIYYASMEGPEAGTYVRGTAKLQGGEATVDLPGHFAKVTEVEGVTVQLTPTGGWHRLYVAEKSNRRVVVRDADGCMNVDFDYLIQGVRRGYKDYQVERDRGVAEVR